MTAMPSPASPRVRAANSSCHRRDSGMTAMRGRYPTSCRSSWRDGLGGLLVAPRAQALREEPREQEYRTDREERKRTGDRAQLREVVEEALPEAESGQR